MAITFNDNIDVSTGKPIDKRYFSGNPYSSVANANSNISISVRHIGLTVNILNEEYWYKDGTSDSFLVKKIAMISRVKVAGNGDIYTGSDYNIQSVVRNDTGNYTITYTIPYSHEPVCQATVQYLDGGLNSHRNIQFYTADETHAKVLIDKVNGDDDDRIFHFTAIGNI